MKKKHEWMVYSTAVGVGAIMVRCRLDGSLGIIRDPTEDEWRKAFYAPVKPYRWHDQDRVKIAKRKTPKNSIRPE